MWLLVAAQARTSLWCEVASLSYHIRLFYLSSLSPHPSAFPYPLSSHNLFAHLRGTRGFWVSGVLCSAHSNVAPGQSCLRLVPHPVHVVPDGGRPRHALPTPGCVLLDLRLLSYYGEILLLEYINIFVKKFCIKPGLKLRQEDCRVFLGY